MENSLFYNPNKKILKTADDPDDAAPKQFIPIIEREMNLEKNTNQSDYSDYQIVSRENNTDKQSTSFPKPYGDMLEELNKIKNMEKYIIDYAMLNDFEMAFRIIDDRKALVKNTIDMLSYAIDSDKERFNTLSEKGKKTLSPVIQEFTLKLDQLIERNREFKRVIKIVQELETKYNEKKKAITENKQKRDIGPKIIKKQDKLAAAIYGLTKLSHNLTASGFVSEAEQIEEIIQSLARRVGLQLGA